jgi:uncharacterized protein
MNADGSQALRAANALGEDLPSSGLIDLAQRHRRMLLPLLYLGSALRHVRSLSRLWNAQEGSLLQKLVAARPEIWQMLRVRFVSANWPARERFARIIDHCRVVETMGRPFNIRPNEYAMLLELKEISGGCWLMLDSPRWLLREGLLALNLVQERDRFFSIAFILAWEDQELVAYVGGVQGRRGPGVLGHYRQFTKQAHGSRPSDTLFELFRSFCAKIGVGRILCVSDSIRNGRTALNSRRVDYADPVTFDYDALWRERGGRLRPDGFYELDVLAPERPDSDVPRNRRALRRRRTAMFEALDQRLGAVLEQPEVIRIGEHEPFP